MTFGSVVLGDLHCRVPAPPAELRGGDVAIMLHGVGGSGRQLLPMAQEAGVPAVLVDLPGHGASPVPTDDGPEALVRFVLGVVDAVQARRVWLVGHSFGGFLALMAAAQRPGAF